MGGLGPLRPLCRLGTQLLSLLGVALGFCHICLSVEVISLGGELVSTCLCFWVGATPLALLSFSDTLFQGADLILEVADLSTWDVADLLPLLLQFAELGAGTGEVLGRINLGVVLDQQGRVAASILGEVPSERTLVELVRDVAK